MYVMLFVSNSLLYQISNDRLPRCSSCILSTSIASFPNMVLERWIIDILSFILYHLQAPTWFSICLTYYTTYHTEGGLLKTLWLLWSMLVHLFLLYDFFFTWVRQLKVLVNSHTAFPCFKSFQKAPTDVSLTTILSFLLFLKYAGELCTIASRKE